eukprot:8520622-Alexandrium_andersonii.AAC.1
MRRRLGLVLWRGRACGASRCGCVGLSRERAPGCCARPPGPSRAEEPLVGPMRPRASCAGLAKPAPA